jgi:hypothetical protein
VEDLGLTYCFGLTVVGRFLWRSGLIRMDNGLNPIDGLEAWEEFLDFLDVCGGA